MVRQGRALIGCLGLSLIGCLGQSLIGCLGLSLIGCLGPYRGCRIVKCPFCLYLPLCSTCQSVNLCPIKVFFFVLILVKLYTYYEP
ncbi:unnamed protein product [Gadus morhua 'NCC']